MTRTAPPCPAPAPEAAGPLVLATAGGEAATGDVTGLHHPLHRAAGHAPGPALTLGATDVPPAVAATAITNMDTAATAAPHRDVTGPILGPTAGHPRQSSTHVAGATGPVPGHATVGLGTGGLRTNSDAGPRDLQSEPTGAGQDRQYILSVLMWMVSSSDKMAKLQLLCIFMYCSER